MKKLFQSILVIISIIASNLATYIERSSTVGCDGVLGSGRTIDICGVCGGEERTCRLVKGIFRSQDLISGFHLIVKIPAGATHINVTEEYSHDSTCYIALRSSGIDGQYYINGMLNFGIPDPAKFYSIAGTTIEYQSPFRSSPWEALLAEGPINENLDVMIFYQGYNPGIHYGFIVPHREVTQSQRAVLTSIDIHNDRFSTSNQGENEILSLQDHFHTPNSMDTNYSSQILSPIHPSEPERILRVPVNVNSQSDNEEIEILASKYHYSNFGNGNTDDSEPLKWEVKSRNSDPRREAIEIVEYHSEVLHRDTAWRSRGFGPCSKTCAGGFRTTTVRCVLIESNREMNDSFCSDPLPRITYRKCNRQSCPAYYSVKRWSDCSTSCGIGQRARRVTCEQLFVGNFTTTVSQRKCSSLTKPSTHEICQLQQCANWKVIGEWSKCNTLCGSGTQTRRTICKSGNGEYVSSARCPLSTRPASFQSCEAGPCVTRWYISEWEKCSSECGPGLQRRNVYCINTADSLSGCPVPLKPNKTRSCARKSCGIKLEWFAGSWSSCSSECGSGIRIRTVVCLRVSLTGLRIVSHTTNCNAVAKPATQQQCNEKPCSARWYYTTWSECSAACGGGSRTRDVECLFADGRFSSVCSLHDRPRHTETCNTIACPSATGSGCEDRSRSCKFVLQARFCGYNYYRRVCCRTCSSASLLSIKSARLTRN